VSKISVAMAVYNGETYLPEQLDSILSRMLEITGVQNSQLETFSSRIQQMNEILSSME